MTMNSFGRFQDTSSTSSMTTRENPVRDLDEARAILNGLQARCAFGVDKKEDLKDFTEALSLVTDALTRMELQNNRGSCDDSGTASTVPVSEVSSESSPRFSPVESVEEISQEPSVPDGSFAISDSSESVSTTTESPPQPMHKIPEKVSTRDADGDDYHLWYTEVANRLRRKKEPEAPRIARNEDFIDELEFSQGLSGYENGFYPPRDTMSYGSQSTGFTSPPTSRKERSRRSPRSFHRSGGSPTNSRAKASVSSEESQCYYCQIGKCDGDCKGTKFCI